MLKEKISSLYWPTVNNLTLFLTCWIYLLCGCNTLLISQEFNPSFNRILLKDGLIDKHNEFIRKDSKGLLWISSLEGPFLYDGLNLSHYQSSKKNGMLGENIQSNFIEDSHGNVWFSTDKGINRYVRRTDSFDSYRLKNEDGDIIENGYKLFYIENDSIIWLSVKKKIYRYNPYTKQQNHILGSEGVRFAIDTFPNGMPKLIIACPWLNDSGVQFIYFDQNGIPTEKYFFKNGIPSQSKQQIEISKAIIENDSLVWLFSSEGILELNPWLPESVKSYSLKGAAYELLKDGVLLDEQYLLICTKNSGIWIFNKEKKVFEKNFTVQDNTNKGLSSESLREIYLDDEEILWLSHYYEPAIDFTWIFNNNFINPFDSIAGVNPKVNSIIEDHRSRIWCSTENNGVFVFQNKTLLHHYNFSTNAIKSEVGPDKIKQLSLDKAGRVWGISDHEIFYIHKEKWLKYHSVPYTIFSFIHSPNSSLILSTNKGIIQLIDNSSKSGEILMCTIEEQPGFQVSRLFPSTQNRFFASSNGNSILIYQWENEQYKLESKIEIRADIYDIFEDEVKNRIWVSTSNGLWDLDLDSKSLNKTKSPAEVGENASIISYFKTEFNYDVLVLNGNIWIIDVNKNNAFRFGKECGIISGQFSLFASLEDANGEIWLGTNNGILCFDPTEIKPYPFPSKVLFKKLWINNNLIENASNVNELSQLELNHYENSFEIEVQGITNYHPELTQIMYTLENYNEDWKTISNNGVLQFTKIPPGKYLLKVISINANNVKSELRELDINISHPWWSELWFKLACVLGFSLLGFGIFRLVLNRKLAQQRLVYDALQNERNRIASEMHDDLGSGLYSIKILLQGVQDQSISTEVSEKVSKVEHKTTKLVENMREIIWAMDGGNDNFPDLIAYIRTFFLEFFDETSINAKAQIPTDLPNSIISGKERRSVFLCIKEAVHNIAKHSNADEAELLFKKTQRKFIIEVRDNGQGINLESSNKFGNGLENMKRRMEEIQGKCIVNSTSGTSIILEIPIKQLGNFHNSHP